MPASRKRKLGRLVASSQNHYAESDPPPFAPAHLSMYKAYCGPLPRTITSGFSPFIINLVLVAGQRLKVRDFAAASAVLPTLFKRYRKVRNYRWFFSREIASTGAVVLRRNSRHFPDLLDDFLAYISRDGYLASHTGPEGYAVRTREAVLLERVMDLLAEGKFRTAVDAMFEQSQHDHFRNSALVQGYLGVVALAASSKEHDPSHMLRVSSTALNAASSLEPTAYYYAYYAAAAAMAAGRKQEALDILRAFIVKRNSSDPAALFGVLSLLGKMDEKNTEFIRYERVHLARRLLQIDPLSKLAIDVLQEAHAWAWPTSPPVDSVELAEAIGASIEHGESGNAKTWLDLANTMRNIQEEERAVFWDLSGRSQWWPTHYFRLSRLNGDIARDASLAAVKAAVGSILMHPTCPYADGARAFGVADSFKVEGTTISW